MSISIPQPTQTVERLDPQIPHVLPHERMFSVQIGGKLYKLSGASLSSDAPSYFTGFFQEPGNENKVLAIDRDPAVFDKIATHLRGYAIAIENEYEFLYLFADSIYFHLEKLRNRLLEEGLWLRVGGKSYHIPKSILFQKGNSPNYFTVMWDTLKHDPFLKTGSLLRPPPMSPFSIDRSPHLFCLILRALQGDKIVFDCNNSALRESLAEECRYYQLYALEQEFIPSDVRYNPYTEAEEVVLKYTDINRRYIEPLVDCEDVPTYLSYRRPQVDKLSRILVMQIESSEVSLFLNIANSFVSLVITGSTANKVHRLLEQYTDDLMYDGSVPKLTLLVHMDQCAARINDSEMAKNWIGTLIEKARGTYPDDDVMEEEDCLNVDDGSVPQCDAEDPSGMEVEQPQKQSQQQQQRQQQRQQQQPQQSSPPVPPRVIVLRLLKSQWSVSVVGRKRIWLNGIQVAGIADHMHFARARGWI